MGTGKSKKKFNIGVDLFDDLRIRRLIKWQKTKEVAVYFVLLCEIYKNGYYIKKDDELARIVSDTLDLETFEEADGFIDDCVEAGLFDKDLYQKERVLTSEEIQNQYRSKTKMITEYAIETEPVEESDKLPAEIATRVRKEKFMNALRPYTSQYGSRMIEKFFNYWSEMNPSKTKMRFEKEKTWELGKRLAYWAGREKVGYQQRKSNIASYDNHTTYKDF